MVIFRTPYWISNMEILTVGTLKRAKLRHLATFLRNWSNRSRHMAIFRFFKMAAAAILDFQILWILMSERSRWPNCVPVPNFVEIGSNRGRDIAIFRFFQDGGRPPSWICDACVRTTCEGHLVVFITVQNLVAIDIVVSIICNFYYFVTWA